jgi:hypothetical protein
MFVGWPLPLGGTTAATSTYGRYMRLVDTKVVTSNLQRHNCRYRTYYQKAGVQS